MELRDLDKLFFLLHDFMDEYGEKCGLNGRSMIVELETNIIRQSTIAVDAAIEKKYRWKDYNAYVCLS
ncbi:hypothetical protein SELR_pSRC300690 (plasmid) [Selenomonas ruminantium subsp. lactilytica TAM6421]|uniref:Uncharacterized protein n=1 Tax=Selenomonas ruminantium subsp. lactilytica (strain NBRC 103574 / TAM6421) TaxID=927704 RepID=I0GWK5_SELRL|nr:hypothetical protein [Selenomonas ruminantium]BAL85142.1 hypothetical protein SELR_pSRC300690 [Selenomonas ruminantium subsp. lactilytica TAM6421]